MESGCLPTELALQVGSQVLQQDLLVRKQTELWSSQSSTTLQLSRSSTTFSRLLAPKIYSHIAITYNEEDDIARLVFLFQLLRTLDRQIVRESIRSLTLDFRQIDFRGFFDVTDLEEKWATFSEEEETRMFGNELNELNSLLESLAEKLRNLPLKHFEWRGVWRLPPAFYKILGELESLESVALDWTSSGLPCIPEGCWIESPYSPEPLHELKQVRAAALGMGCRVIVVGGRSEGLYDPETTDFSCPGLISWLTGKNSLKYLFLAAPILYYRKELLPCWVKMFSIVDDTPNVSSDGIKYTNFGEYCRTHQTRMEEETSIDQPFAEAAKKFRSLIHSKHQEVLRSSKASSLTPQDVLDLIYSAQPLCVYRSWFSRSYSDAGQESEEKVKELRILEEVVSRWNETAGESADPEEVEKFSKKSHFLLEPESGNKRDP